MRTWTCTPWTTTALADAIALRERGLSYGSIAIALEHFHGIRPINSERVRNAVRAAGADPEPRHSKGYLGKGTAA